VQSPTAEPTTSPTPGPTVVAGEPTAVPTPYPTPFPTEVSLEPSHGQASKAGLDLTQLVCLLDADPAPQLPSDGHSDVRAHGRAHGRANREPNGSPDRGAYSGTPHVHSIPGISSCWSSERWSCHVQELMACILSLFLTVSHRCADLRAHGLANCEPHGGKSRILTTAAHKPCSSIAHVSPRATGSHGLAHLLAHGQPDRRPYARTHGGKLPWHRRMG
jgi:hypothetical protein